MYFTDQILKFLKAREKSILVENYHLSRIFAQLWYYRPKYFIFLKTLFVTLNLLVPSLFVYIFIYSDTLFRILEVLYIF